MAKIQYYIHYITVTAHCTDLWFFLYYFLTIVKCFQFCSFLISCFNCDVKEIILFFGGLGVFTDDVAMFGNSWIVEEPQITCSILPSLFQSPCFRLDPLIIQVSYVHNFMSLILCIYLLIQMLMSCFTHLHSWQSG